MLLPHHKKMLEESVIAETVWQARGYYSIEKVAELRRLGFNQNQSIVPTLLVPIHDVWGEISLYHHRPDRPRVNSKTGRTNKYEFPSGSMMCLDVHPFVKDKIRDPNIPLLITEGSKKNDSLISHGGCSIAVVGVWNWCGTNEWGGKTTLPDWEGIALKKSDDSPRLVYIIFDSDAMLKPAVYLALSRLAEFLKKRGAKVLFVYLPHCDDGSKTGVDDFLARGHTLSDVYDLASPVLKTLPEEPKMIVPYTTSEHGLIWSRPSQEGATPTPLTNFSAQIVADVTQDDGQEQQRLLEIEAICLNRTTRFMLTGPAFQGMNWPLEKIGSDAIIYPGQLLREHTRVAIQSLSPAKVQRTDYTHTGWCKVEDQWFYLHGDGAIGAQDSSDISVSLPSALSSFRFQPAPNQGETQRAVSATMGLIMLAPDHIIIPVLAATMRSVLGPCDFSLNLVGPSNAFKSEVAALSQQHFGAGFTSRNLPASWTSTENALEGLAFTAKDAILVIDDFAPRGANDNVNRIHAKADRVLRAQGNNAGRGRMNADGTLRVTKAPRGLILSTGEDAPQGHSLRSRQLIIEISPGDVDAEILTYYQRDAKAGLYAQTMTAFLKYLAPNYEEIRENLRPQVEELRQETDGVMRRTSEIVANLFIGWRTFLEFAVAVGAITTIEKDHHEAAGLEALQLAAAQQGVHQQANEPAERFLELISQCLALGRAHLASAYGVEPEDPDSWGWRIVTVGAGDFMRDEWREQGARIGFVDEDNVYLVPDAAFDAVKRIANQGADGIAIASKTLSKRLHERGLLQSTEGDTLTVRKMLSGRRQRVWHLSATLFRGEPRRSSAVDALPVEDCEQ